MADLQAYIDFSVLLDRSLTTPAILLTDTGAYPSGVPAGITGAFSVTQPDGATIAGNFTTPDISFVSGSLTHKSIELRLASNGSFQKGLYSITYTVRHGSYTETVVTRTFRLNYAAPVVKIQEDFDVFIPKLTVADVSNYSVPSLTFSDITRLWAATIAEVGDVSATTESFDLAYAGDYYDASYLVSLAAYITYSVVGASWASVKDKISVTASYKTQVPDSLNTLYAEITTYQKNISDKCCKDDKYNREDYVYAFSLFQHLIMRGKCAGTLGLRSYINDIKKVLNGGVGQSYTLTGAPILPYSFTDFCGGCGCGDDEEVATPLSILTQPVSASIADGATASFNVIATGGVPSYSYQLQKLSGTWADVAGATSVPYNIAGATSDNNGTYRWKVTDSVGNIVYSNNVTLTVAAPVTTIMVTHWYTSTDPFVDSSTAPTITSPINQSISSGSDIEFLLPADAADKFWGVKEPVTEPVKTAWYHNTDNSGSIPGLVRVWVVGSFRYYATTAEFTLTYTDSIQLTSS